jgi:hypothetical protein
MDKGTQRPDMKEIKEVQEQIALIQGVTHHWSNYSKCFHARHCISSCLLKLKQDDELRTQESIPILEDELFEINYT